MCIYIYIKEIKSKDNIILKHDASHMATPFKLATTPFLHFISLSLSPLSKFISLSHFFKASCHSFHFKLSHPKPSPSCLSHRFKENPKRPWSLNMLRLKAWPLLSSSYATTGHNLNINYSSSHTISSSAMHCIMSRVSSMICSTWPALSPGKELKYFNVILEHIGML